jgi:hypothetical protein
MLFNVYQESSSPYQRPWHAQAKTEINLIIRKKLWKPVFSSKNNEGIAGVLSLIGVKVNTCTTHKINGNLYQLQYNQTPMSSFNDIGQTVGVLLHVSTNGQGTLRQKQR